MKKSMATMKKDKNKPNQRNDLACDEMVSCEKVSDQDSC